MPKISTIIISFNEERSIGRCIESVADISDEIVVVDSGSTDRTAEIARRYTERVITRSWPGYGKQKQWALAQASHEWVFSVDADEEVSPELKAEIEALDFRADGYYLPRRVRYLNRWINHSGWYPDYVLRLFRKEKGTFTDNILHESVVLEGATERLKNDLYHYSYRDVSHHLEKMNAFTSLAAKQMYNNGRRAGFHSVTVVPFFEFIKVYFLKRGILDGLPGLVIATLHACYIFQKYAKLFEMGLNKKGAAS